MNIKFKMNLDWITYELVKTKKLIPINKFFETDLIIKVNVKNERRFDRPTVIFKFKVRSKN